MNKKTQRQELIEQRLNMPDRLQRADPPAKYASP
ncbi:MAG: hypothetical protein RJA29_2812, partial [Pseudomonadota bacterium]